jgi:serine/threonine protein kinase
LHKARLVYTDLKAENLISMDQGENDNGGILFKGVDLESAIPHRGHPLDYTPEASPPEFAIQYLQGEAYDFILEYSYDIWSFGMLAHELATGRNFFSKKQPVQIMKQLGMGSFEPPDVDGSVEDPKLCDLIKKCLHLDPKQRPTATQIANHLYFRTDSPRLFGW